MSSVLNTATRSGAGFNQMVDATRDVYSAEIYLAALPVMKLDQFTTKRTELGTQPGKTITMQRYGNIKRGGPLTEGRRLETQPMSMTGQQITVIEYGNAVGFSEYLLQTSFYDQLSAASLLLGRDMALALDIALKLAIFGATNVVYGGKKTARNLVAVADVFNTTCIKDACEVLETNNAPKWAGDHYICFIHPHQARGLRDDNDWTNAALYAGATQIYTGEIGRYNDVRFVTTTVMPNGVNGAVDSVTGDFVDVGYSAGLANAGAAGIDIYQAIMFGEYTLGHATGLPVELRDSGVQDYGREHGLAWYSIWGQGLLENANVVVIETS